MKSLVGMVQSVLVFSKSLLWFRRAQNVGSIGRFMRARDMNSLVGMVQAVLIFSKSLLGFRRAQDV